MTYRNRMVGGPFVALAAIALSMLAASRGAAQSGPVVSLSATSLTFPSTPLLTKSAVQFVTLTNTGGSTLSISGIAISGSESKDFSENDNCNGSVAAAASCTISVTFTPLLFGPATGTLAITDNAPGSPQNVSLSGTGMGPAVTLSSMTVNFSPQLATTTSAPQVVTLTNSGDAALTFSSVILTGTFAETNTCPTGSATLAAGSSCTFSVTFVPPAGGSAVGLIEITDNASPLPQAIELTGTGEDFSLSASPSSSSVTPGGSASYTITVTPVGGFNAAVSFTCGTLPTGAACSFSPASVTPSGSAGATTTLTISTTGSGSAPPGRRRPSPPAGRAPLWTLWMLIAILAGFAAALARKSSPGRRPAAAFAGLVLAGLLVAALAAPGCGGGGSSGTTSTPTPAGTTMVLVTGSTPAGSSSVTNPVVVTLVVQ